MFATALFLASAISAVAAPFADGERTFLLPGKIVSRADLGSVDLLMLDGPQEWDDILSDRSRDLVCTFRW